MFTPFSIQQKCEVMDKAWIPVLQEHSKEQLLDGTSYFKAGDTQNVFLTAGKHRGTCKRHIFSEIGTTLG